MRAICAVMVALAIGSTLAGAASPPAAPGSVRAQMELNQQFYYVGEPMNVRLSILNDGAAEIANPVRGSLFGSFVVTDSQGRALERQAKPDAKEPSRPDKLAANSFYGAVIDLSQMYPQLRSKGRYSIKWSSDAVSADEIGITVIPKFDPSRDYTANVETELGTFVVDLHKRTAPIAVKAFVDLANAGFYDGLVFYEARADQLLSGGDPTGTGRGQAPLRYPAELSAVPVITGSVVLKSAGLAPPANSSQFVVSLQPQPTWTGQFTVLGQVVAGLEVVRKLAGVPTSDPPSYRPLKDLHTLHVTIEEKNVPVRTATGSN